MVAFSLFVTTLQRDLGWSRTQIMGAFTIFVFVIGITSPFAGRLVDGYGARKVISMGSLVAGIGLVLLSQMKSLWHFYAGYAVIGAGITAIGPVTSSYVVSHWFSRRRGMALGIMAMGMGCSGIIFAPFVAVYLIPHFGWSNAYLALAVINSGLVIPLSLFVVKTKPADIALYPDGIEASEAANRIEEKHETSEGLSLKLALGTPAFWLIAVSVLLNHNHVGIVQNVVPYLSDIGFPVGIVASSVGIVGMTASLSMFFFGWLCDKIAAKYASAIGLGLTALGILICINIGPGSPVELIWLYAVVMGFGVGSWMPTLSMLTSTTFGLGSYGATFGMMSLFQYIGAGTGPLIAGYLYDSMNTYHWAFIIILAMIVLAIPVVLAVRRPALRA